MNWTIIPRVKIIERMIINGRLIGIWISGSFLFLLNAFAFFAMRRIMMPVSPPETTPPIPRMRVNFTNSSCVVRR